MKPSKLINELQLTKGELTGYIRQFDIGANMAKALRSVIDGKSYAQAGKPHGISRQALYQKLKRIYRVKHGKGYKQHE